MCFSFRFTLFLLELKFIRIWRLFVEATLRSPAAQTGSREYVSTHTNVCIRRERQEEYAKQGESKEAVAEN